MNEIFFMFPLEETSKPLNFFWFDLLYLLGPSSRQKVSVKVASSSKNSVAKESHQQLSLSCNKKIRIIKNN